MSKIVMVINNRSTKTQNLIEAFENGGYDKITASNTAETLNKCLEFHPNLVLMDVDMPIKDEYSLSKELKKSPDTKDIKVIIIKSKNSPLDKTWATIKGSDFYFSTTNPFKEDSLIESITTLH